jgi:hypothetical protein
VRPTAAAAALLSSCGPPVACEAGSSAVHVTTLALLSVSRPNTLLLAHCGCGVVPQRPCGAGSLPRTGLYLRFHWRQGVSVGLVSVAPQAETGWYVMSGSGQWQASLPADSYCPTALLHGHYGMQPPQGVSIQALSSNVLNVLPCSAGGLPCHADHRSTEQRPDSADTLWCW